MAKRSKKTKKNAGPAGLNSAFAMHLADLPEMEQRALVLSHELDYMDAELFINGLLEDGWKLDGRQFHTEAGDVLLFEREKKS